ncbi:MAG: AEC family transporter [Lachnospiraceae bacterium]
MKEYILTPVNAAIVVGLIMFIFQLRFPAPVDNAVQGMSSLTTPMAMLYVGTILTKSSIKDVFSDWRTYACSFVRLVLIPLLVLMIARPLIHDPMIYGVLVIGTCHAGGGFLCDFCRRIRQ